jgi:hypothetical protein
MSALQEYFAQNPGRLIHKWLHYFEIYERHFSRFRNREVHVMEIGVFHGGSLQMWKHYFGPLATIYGVDVNPSCRQLEEKRVRIFVGDQGDRSFLRSLRNAVRRIDVLIDDGGHRMDQQIATFEELFHHVSEDGVYLCEDVHTSYFAEYGGGLRRAETFVEYSKRLIDQLNAWFTRDPEELEVDDFTLAAHSLHFYPSVIVIEKQQMEMPQEKKTGMPAFGPSRP